MNLQIEILEQKTSSIQSLLCNFIRQVKNQIFEVPSLPTKETTIKINRLRTLRDYLIVEKDKFEFDNFMSKKSILTPNKRNLGTGAIKRVRLSIKDERRANEGRRIG